MLHCKCSDAPFVFLWSPYVIGQIIYIFMLWFVMVALWNRADHYIFMLWFVLLLLGKKLVKQQYVLHMSPQYGEHRPTSSSSSSSFFFLFLA